MSVFFRGSKYRIIETASGMYFVEKKHFFPFGWLYVDPTQGGGLFDRLEDAEAAMQRLRRADDYPKVVKYVKHGE